MGVFLSSLYLYLYVMLQLEDMALLFGSIGLFIVLAIVMFFSRKIDWYNLGNNKVRGKENEVLKTTPPPYIPIEDKEVENKESADL